MVQRLTYKFRATDDGKKKKATETRSAAGLNYNYVKQTEIFSSLACRPSSP